jgi:indole-3-glycerol phosphate synthase
VQGFPQWTPPIGVLGELVALSRRRAAALEGAPWATGDSVPAQDAPLRFAAALRTGSVAVIAEVKRSSPSKGAINPGLSAAEQARRYEQGGAAALSILTEPTRFGGDDADVGRARAATRIPVLRKDFLVHPLQIREARLLGASAALLIARALSPVELETLARAAADCGLEALIEIRDEWELERAITAGATMIGVNNRNLETLEIDPATSERMIPLIPPEVVAIAESGVSSRLDVERYAAAGADAVLVGSSISAAADAVAAVRALTGVPRRPRGG